MGSIITALEMGKPIIVMPRRCELGEQRNNHQISTAKKFLEQGTIHVAMDETELSDRLANIDRIQCCGRVNRHASPQLLQTLSDFVNRGKVPGRVVVSPSPEMPPASSELRPVGQHCR
jgi:UDP-N-acetylglucosamine transferase subunit ALG13